MEFTVVVTGFGPFEKHPVNASWETVKALLEMIQDFKDKCINLITEELPVIYESVVGIIPVLWEKHKPQLMVHIGVSGIATAVTLETLAFKEGYKRHDVIGCVPDSGQCCVGEEECIVSGLDLEKVCLQVNSSSNIPVSTCISQNAGRYLCEFSFYTSLSIDRDRAVFIHVPDINKPYSVSDLAVGVKNIIFLLVDQLQCKKL